MVCRKCGAVNGEDAMFCENCGGDLHDTGQRKISKWLFVLAAEVIGLLLLIFVEVTAMEGSRTAEKTAERYFVYTANGDWQEAYELLQLTEIQGWKGAFIGPRALERAQGTSSLGIVQDYKIRQENGETGSQSFSEWFQKRKERGNDEESSSGTYVIIDYQTQDNAESSSFAVDLQEMSGEWKVKIMDYVCQNYRIYVPAGAEVRVDEVMLDEDYIIINEEESYEGMDGYLIPYIFVGAHSIAVTLEGMEEVADTIWLQYDSSPYYLEHMPMKQETLEELLKKSEENMQQIYSAALEGKSGKAIEGLCTSEAEQLQEIQESYQYLLSGFHESSVQPEKIEFYDIVGEVTEENNSVFLQFKYKMEYTQENWSGKSVRDTYEGDGEAQFDFIKEDGNWVQTNLGCRELY